MVAAATTRPGVLFDLDGTLVDTNYLHALAWSRAFAQAGEWAPMNAIHRLVGMGGDQLVPALLGRDSEEASSARNEKYRALASEIRAFPGASALLRRAHETSLVVVLATSSPADEVDTALTVLGPGDTIDVVTTADDVQQSKPQPEVFIQAMRRGGIDPARALAVGDSIWDIRAARAAGIGCVAVESGGFSRHELSEDGALAVYRDVEELRLQFWTSPLGLLAGS